MLTIKHSDIIGAYFQFLIIKSCPGSDQMYQFLPNYQPAGSDDFKEISAQFPSNTNRNFSLIELKQIF